MAADRIAAALSSFSFVIALLLVESRGEQRCAQHVPVLALKQM
jgi:hypothetical protein